jgi:hypothetical protein
VAVRQWVDPVQGPTAWVSLDVLDRDPASFWSDLLGAISSVVPAVGDEPAMLLAERGADDPLFVDALIAHLERWAMPIVVVLDAVAGTWTDGAWKGSPSSRRPRRAWRPRSVGWRPTTSARTTRRSTPRSPPAGAG